MRENLSQRVVMVTGPSGAGRSSAINALEDLGYEAIDNLPMSLIPRLLDGPPLPRPMALGLDVRNRDFSSDMLIEVVDTLHRQPGVVSELLYLDCSVDTLVRRFSETRRRHPLSPEDAPMTGILHERALLDPLRNRADVLIDTSDLTPHALRAEIARWFGPRDGRPMALSVQSFSYKRGLPRGVDMVFDCRFLVNPHWEPSLRPLTGRDAEVVDFLNADPLASELFHDIEGLIRRWVPHFIASDRAYLTLAVGCTGGQHRSVYLIERLYAALQNSELPIRSHAHHRELGS